MPNDVIEKNHWERNEQDEAEGLASEGTASNTGQSRPLVLDPPICDEQEWHRF